MQSKKPSGATWKKYFLTNVLKHEAFTLAIILIALVVVFGVTTHGLSLDRSNIANILVQSSMLGVAAVGQALVILTAGIDLSIGGIALMVVCLGGALMTTTAGFLGPISMAAALLIMLLAGAGLGAVNGLLVSRLRMPALIVTLAMWQIARGVSYELTLGLEDVAQIIRELPPGLAFIAHEGIGGVPNPVFIFVAAIVVGYFVLNHTSLGKSVYAVGGDEVVAWLSGIKTRNILFWVYVISGLCAAIAGMVQISRVMCASYRVISGLELDSIAAVVIGGVSLFGGKGSIIGVLIGVLILGTINNGMNLMGLNTFMQDLVKGAVIITAVTIDAVRRGRIGG